MAGLRLVHELLAHVLRFKGNGVDPGLDAQLKRSTFVVFFIFVVTVGVGLFLLYKAEERHIEEVVRTVPAHFRAFHEKAISGSTLAYLSTRDGAEMAEYVCLEVTTSQMTIPSERRHHYQSFCSDYAESLAKGNPDQVQPRVQRLTDLIRGDIHDFLPLHRNSSYIWAWFISSVLYLVAEGLLYRFSSLEHRDLEPAFNVLDVSFVGILVQYSGGFQHPMTMINLVLPLYCISLIAVALDYVHSGKFSRVALSFFWLLVSLFWCGYDGRPTAQFLWSYLGAFLAFAAVFGIVLILASQRRAAAHPNALPLVGAGSKS